MTDAPTPKPRRPKAVLIHVSEAEHAELLAAAERYTTSVSEYVRWLHQKHQAELGMLAGRKKAAG